MEINMSSVTINPAGSPQIVQRVHGATAAIDPAWPASVQTGAPQRDEDANKTKRDENTDKG